MIIELRGSGRSAELRAAHADSPSSGSCGLSVGCSRYGPPALRSVADRMVGNQSDTWKNEPESEMTRPRVTPGPVMKAGVRMPPSCNECL